MNFLPDSVNSLNQVTGFEGGQNEKIDQAQQTQLENIQLRTGKTLPELYKILSASGLKKHGELRTFTIKQLELGYGDANTLVHVFRAAQNTEPEPEIDPLDQIYSGKNETLREIHNKNMAEIERFGVFGVAPKKKYISLRRNRQFAMLGPGTRGRFEVGLNMKDIPETERLIAQPAGGMCQYKVFLTGTDEVDSELLQWIRQAYDSAA